MAKASVTKAVVTTVTGVSLDLTPLEAYTLYDILCRIGGNPDSSMRKYAHTMFLELSEIFKGLRDFDCQGDIIDWEFGQTIHYKEGSTLFAEKAVQQLNLK